MIRPSQVTHVTRPARSSEYSSRVATKAGLASVRRKVDAGRHWFTRTHGTRPRVSSRDRFAKVNGGAAYARFRRTFQRGQDLTHQHLLHQREWNRAFEDHLRQVMQSTQERLNDTMLRAHFEQQNEGLKGLFRTLEEPLPPGHYEVEQALEDGKVVYRFVDEPLIRPLPHNDASDTRVPLPDGGDAVVRSNDPAEGPSSRHDHSLDPAIDASPSDPDYFLKGGQ